MRHAEAHEAFDHMGQGDRCQRAAQAFGNARVAHRVRLDAGFVDQAGRGRRRRRDRGQRSFNDRLGREPGRIDRVVAMQRERLIEGKETIDPPRVGIDEQLRRIETMAGARIPRSLGAQPVFLARAKSRQKTIVQIAVDFAQREARDLIVFIVEQTDENAFGMAGRHADDRAVARQPKARTVRARAAVRAALIHACGNAALSRFPRHIRGSCDRRRTSPCAPCSAWPYAASARGRATCRPCGDARPSRRRSRASP